MCENIKIYNDDNMKNVKNIQIRKYTNIHVEKYKCEKCQRVCKRK